MTKVQTLQDAPMSPKRASRRSVWDVGGSSSTGGDPPPPTATAKANGVPQRSVSPNGGLLNSGRGASGSPTGSTHLPGVLSIGAQLRSPLNAGPPAQANERRTSPISQDRF